MYYFVRFLRESFNILGFTSSIAESERNETVAVVLANVTAAPGSGTLPEIFLQAV